MFDVGSSNVDKIFIISALETLWKVVLDVYEYLLPNLVSVQSELNDK